MRGVKISAFKINVYVHIYLFNKSFQIWTFKVRNKELYSSLKHAQWFHWGPACFCWSTNRTFVSLIHICWDLMSARAGGGHEWNINRKNGWSVLFFSFCPAEKKRQGSELKPWTPSLRCVWASLCLMLLMLRLGLLWKSPGPPHPPKKLFFLFWCLANSKEPLALL